MVLSCLLGDKHVQLNMCQAICEAIDIQLGRDESTIVFGEDVKFGGVFRCTVSSISMPQYSSSYCHPFRMA